MVEINKKPHGNKGKRHSEEAKLKMSEACKGKKLTDEHKRKISEALKGRTSPSPHPMLGKHHTEEHKRRISELLTGRIFTKEVKRKMSEAHKGIKHSEDTKQKFRIIAKERKREKSHNWKGGISQTKEYSRVAHANRRALKKNNGGNFNLGDWELLKKRYGYKCPMCNKKESKIKLTVDHIIPLSKGGSNYIENIQPLCQTCNKKKHTKIIKNQLPFLFSKYD